MIYLLFAIVSAVLLVWMFGTHRRALLNKHNAPVQNPEAQSSVSPLSSEDQEMRMQGPEDINYSEVSRMYRVADMHFARGDLKEAERWFIKVLAEHESHPETLNRLGVIYVQQNNPRRAEIIFRKLFSVTQKEPAYYCNYGRCLYNQGRLEEAIEAYENAIKLDASKPARFISVGQIYYEIQNFEKALKYFVKALELAPQNLEYLTLTVELAEMVGELEILKQSLRKLVKLDPYNESARAKWEKLNEMAPKNLPNEN